MLIGFTDFLRHFWWAILIGSVLIAFGLWLLGRTAGGRRLRDKIVLKVPVIGDLLRYSIVERFCRLLATMMEAGVPLPEAMAVLGEGTNNVVFRDGISEVREAMMRGEGLARPMGDTGLFPSAIIQMVRVGENTGTLDTQLGVGSDYYGQELDYKIARFTALFEPAVIIFMGFTVGFVALALISAMYGIYNQVQV